MKVTCKVMTVVSLCLGLAQIVVAEKIKIAKQDMLNYKKPWTYKLATKKTQDATPVESDPKKFNTKNATITFNDKDDEVIVKVFTDPSNSKNLVLKRGKQFTPYKGKGILVDRNGQPSFIDKSDAPFTPTHKVSVQKQKSDGKEWSIQSVTEGLDPLKDYFYYDEIKIKNSTTSGKGLTVPKNKPFTVNVNMDSKSVNGKWVESKFTAEQAQVLKHINLNDDGKVIFA